VPREFVEATRLCGKVHVQELGLLVLENCEHTSVGTEMAEALRTLTAAATSAGDS